VAANYVVSMVRKLFYKREIYEKIEEGEDIKLDKRVWALLLRC
jgi:hypothetical protein